MTGNSGTTAARLLTIGGLVAAPVGIVILILAGVDFPPIPPGIVITLVGAGVVWLVRRWWAPAIGAAVAAFLLIGGLVSGQAIELLSDPGDVGEFVGMAVLILGLLVALGAGIVATARGRARP